VRRPFAGVDLAEIDPFVHMDQMGEVEYAPGEPKGTPRHPHRGFETVTYMIDGTFEHQDSNGGGRIITNGNTQWMTAGAGILHIEKPPEWLVTSGGLFHGFQLWVNLSAARKWSAPRYQDFRAEDVSLASSPDGVAWRGVARRAGRAGSDAFGRSSRRCPATADKNRPASESRQLMVPRWCRGSGDSGSRRCHRARFRGRSRRRAQIRGRFWPRASAQARLPPNRPNLVRLGRTNARYGATARRRKSWSRGSRGGRMRRATQARTPRRTPSERDPAPG
jgi:hypothetical protein